MQTKYSLGELVAIHRRKKHMSMDAVAEAAGIDTSTYLRIEKGQHKTPRTRVLKAIARVLNIPILKLLQAAGHVGPEDLFEWIDSQVESEILDEEKAQEIRNKTVTQLIEMYGIGDDFDNEHSPEA